MALLAAKDDTGQPRSLVLDSISRTLVTLDFLDYSIHEGRGFEIMWGVADMGAATTPDNAITLSFKTPATNRMHLFIEAKCVATSLLQVFESKTGGGATTTGTVTSLNSDRGSTAVSGVTDELGANVTKMSYDATIFTGGTTLLSKYLGASLDYVSKRGILLAAATVYQVALTEATNVAGDLHLRWVEAANKDATSEF